MLEALSRREIASRAVVSLKLGLWIASIISCASAAAQPTFYFATDVPTDLGGQTFLTNQIVKKSGATYNVEANLDPSITIGALCRRPNGSWLIAPRNAVTLAGTTFKPQDVILFNKAAYSMYLDGSIAGIPSEASIDAVLLDASGSLVFSLDVPASLGAAQYGPADLILYDGTFQMFWNATTAEVPTGSNLVGAALGASGDLIVTFDVPTLIGGIDFLPGELALWHNSSFTSFAMDPAWPPGSQISGLSLPPPTGGVPESGTASGGPLRVNKASGSQIALQWGTSCLASDSDYSVYEGTLGSFESHVPRACSTSAAQSLVLAPMASSAYYLVVPRNLVSEGSYGVGHQGERPSSSQACLPRGAQGCGL